MPPVIERDKCTGCGRCDRHCPLDVIIVDEVAKKALVRYADECWHCGVCRQECPAGAVSIKFPLKMLGI